jgi:hypothetical protein
LSLMNVRGLWKFDGLTADDFSGNANDGTLQNGATYSTDVPTVSNNAPSVSLTHPLNSTSIAAGSTIVMDATASDSDGSVTKVDFYQGTTLLGTDTTAPYRFVWTNVAAGNYSLTAKATDDATATTTSRAIALTVIPPGDGQTADDFSGNANNGTLQNGAAYSTDVPVTGGSSQRPVPNANGPYSKQVSEAVQFSSSGSVDPDGSIAAYYWNFGDGTSANTANPSHSYSAPCTPPR